ncbi:Fc.00g032920.m01.CDS01 [Cosmosporella sp. VM-42]
METPYVKNCVADTGFFFNDSFGGEVLPADVILNSSDFWGKLDLTSFFQRNSKEIRSPEIINSANILRSKHERTGAIGFCFGGWGVFQLGAKANHGLVDCISTAHPTNLTKEEIEGVFVPVQICAPEFDPMFSEEMKAFCNEVIPTLGVPYDYQYFPNLSHGFAVRGDSRKLAEREGMERAKNAVVLWFRQWLHSN